VAVHVEKVIHAAAPDVARIMFDALDESGWISGVGSAELLTPGPLAVGSRIRRRGHFLGSTFDWVTEVTAFEPGRLLRLKFLEGIFHGEVTFEVTPTAGGCIAIVRNDDAKRSPVGTWAIEGAIEHDLERLAVHVAEKLSHTTT
jgi:hypothetical protein